NAPVNALAYDGANDTLYAATDLGVFFMQNDDKVWEKLGDNVPSAATEDLKLQASGGSLYVATFGRGTWRIPLVPGSPPYSDANIQISPNAKKRVGGTQTFTAHVNVDGGSGFVPAPDGTSISF